MRTNLQDHEILLSSGRDLKDFFYQFRVSRERARRNCLTGVLNRAQLREVFGDVPGLPDRGYVGLSTRAMGDCSACKYAQASHLAVLYGAQVFDGAELITLENPVPRRLESSSATSLCSRR